MSTSANAALGAKDRKRDKVRKLFGKTSPIPSPSVTGTSQAPSTHGQQGSSSSVLGNASPNLTSTSHHTASTSLNQNLGLSPTNVSTAQSQTSWPQPVGIAATNSATSQK